MADSNTSQTPRISQARFYRAIALKFPFRIGWIWLHCVPRLFYLPKTEQKLKCRLLEMQWLDSRANETADEKNMPRTESIDVQMVCGCSARREPCVQWDRRIINNFLNGWREKFNATKNVAAQANNSPETDGQPMQKQWNALRLGPLALLIDIFALCVGFFTGNGTFRSALHAESIWWHFCL